jgi:hypothetical protein
MRGPSKFLILESMTTLIRGNLMKNSFTVCADARRAFYANRHRVERLFPAIFNFDQRSLISLSELSHSRACESAQ